MTSRRGTGYLPPSRRSLLRSILAAIDEKRSPLVLIGGRGLGKTDLLRRIASELEGSAQPIFLRCRTGSGPINMPESILAACGILASNPGLMEVVDTLVEIAHRSRSASDRLLLLIDDATQLADESLKAVLDIAILARARTNSIQVVLSGEPPVRIKLAALDCSSFGPSAISIYQIPPFMTGEVAEYIDSVIRSAGETETAVFSSAACGKIAEISGCVPAVIDSLCAKALDEAWDRSKTLVDPDLIAESAPRRTVSERVTADREIAAPVVILNSSDLALIPGESDSTQLHQFVSRHRLIVRSAAAAVVLLFIAAALYDVNWNNLGANVRNWRAMAIGHRSSLMKPGALSNTGTAASDDDLERTADYREHSPGNTTQVPISSASQSPDSSRSARAATNAPLGQAGGSTLSQHLLDEGARLQSTGNYDDAIKTYQAALVADPQNRDVLEAINQVKKAKATEQLTLANPTNDSPHIGGASPKVVRQATHLNVQDALQVQDALRVGRKLLALGNYGEAIRAFQAGLVIDPDNKLLIAELSRAHSARTAEQQVLGSP